MSGSTIETIVSVDVIPVQPVQVIEVDADGTHVDVVSPSAPVIEVDLPDPPQPVVVDVTAAPPVVLVDTPAPLPTPSVDVELPNPITVDVIATPPAPVRVDAVAAWQTGIPDAPADGVIYGRLNKDWVGALGLLTGYAPLNSPTFTGVPTAPTAAQGGAGTDQLATTGYVRSAVLGHPDLVTSVAAKIGDVLIYTGDIEDWDGKVLDGGNF